MNNSNRGTKPENPIKEMQVKYERCKNALINWIISKLALIIGKGKAKKIVITAGVIILFFSIPFAVYKFVIDVRWKPEKTQLPQLPEAASNLQDPVTPVLGRNAPESILEQEKIKTILEAPCYGIPISITEEIFMDVPGKEKWIPSDENDLTVISAPENVQFQGTKRYPFECQLPWIATISATPRKPESIGLFLEFEETIKIIIGDGDRITWKVEKNDNGRREEWTRVKKEKLTNGKISVDKQFTVVIKTSRNGKYTVDLELSINYIPEGKTDYIWEAHVINNVRPKALNLDVNASHKFRIGINDWRFKGKGSELKLGTFSVKTL